MTDEQIIKALECCKDCSANLNLDIINLITLKNAKLLELTVLINRYEADIERYKGVIKLLEKDVAEAKAEGFKELAVLLKQYVESNQVQTTFFGGKCFIDKDTIDNFLKERAGENNA